MAAIPGEPGRYRWLERAALLLTALLLAAKFVVAANLGLDGDEGYYFMWSEWLQPGYFDHPPAVAVMIAAGRALVGDSLLGTRLVALVASLVTVLALFATGRRLLPDSPAPALAVIWYGLSLGAAAGFAATPDAPSTLFWTLALWASVEAVVGRRPGWWLVVGLLAGLGLDAKYTNVWFGAGLVLFLFATAAGRAELRRWQVWAGGALALAVFSPVLWWNAANDWRSFTFQGARAVRFSDIERFGLPTLEFFASQALLAGPVVVVGFAIGLVAFLRRRGAPAELQLPILTSLPMLGYFLFHSLHTTVQANWTAAALPAVTLVAAWAVTRFAGLWPRLLGWGQSGLGALLVGLLYVQALAQPFDLGALDRTRALRGWDGVAAAARAAADATGATAIWGHGSYQLTGELFFWGAASGDPRPVRDLVPHPRYDFVPIGERRPPYSPAIVVAPTRGPEGAGLAIPAYEDVRLVEIVPRLAAGRPVQYFAIYAVAGPTADFPSE